MLYIHQFPDWTKFRFNPGKVLASLGETRMEQGKLLGNLNVVGFGPWEYSLFAQDMENNFAIDGRKSDSSKILDEASLKNKSSIPYIKNFWNLLETPKPLFSLDMLFTLHASMGQIKMHKFRDCSGEICYGEFSFTGPSPDRICNEMEHFIHWLNESNTDGVVKAAIAHFWLLTIRPFKDANGIMARTLSAMLLAKSENTSHYLYALNSEIYKDRENYFRILSKSQKGNGDLTEWILWFLYTLKKAIEKSQQQLFPLVKQSRFNCQHQGKNLTQRQQKFLSSLLTENAATSFTAKDYAIFSATSHDTALRDIQELMKMNIIGKEKKGGRSACYRLL